MVRGNPTGTCIAVTRGISLYFEEISSYYLLCLWLASKGELPQDTDSKQNKWGNFSQLHPKHKKTKTKIHLNPGT